MFKESNRIWWYLIGIVILMGLLLLVARDYVIPVLLGQRKVIGGEFIYASAPKFALDTEVDYLARFKTNMGTFTVDLFEQSAPNNVNNFVFLANSGNYNGTHFHRLIPDFLVQGGDRFTLDDEPSNDGRGNPGYFVSDEINWDYLNFSNAKRKQLADKGYSSVTDLPSHHLERYSLAMASSQPNTNGSQFFFVIADPNDPRLGELDGMFTVIGKVETGTDILDAISHLPVDNPEADNPRPVNVLTLETLEIFTR